MMTNERLLTETMEYEDIILFGTRQELNSFWKQG